MKNQKRHPPIERSRQSSSESDHDATFTELGARDIEELGAPLPASVADLEGPASTPRASPSKAAMTHRNMPRRVIFAEGQASTAPGTLTGLTPLLSWQ